jgi:hypothetical protein
MELELLIDLTRAENDEALAAALWRCNGIDWKKFIELSEHHRVECLVAFNLAAHKSASIPDTVRDHFINRLKHHTLHSLAATRATLQVADAFSDARIPYVLLKGLAVSMRFYGSPNERQSIDIDILVSESEVMRAQSIIESLGFEQYFPKFVVPPSCDDAFRALACDVSYRRSSDGMRLELHWRLDRNSSFLNWDFPAVWRLTTQMPMAGVNVSLLEPSAQLNYLICHGAKHAWFRLKWLADIYRMLEVLTYEQSAQVVRLSQCNGTMRMLATSLQLVRHIYGVSTPNFSEHLLNSYEDKQLLSYMIKSIVHPVDLNAIRMRDIGNLFQWYRYLLHLRPELSYKRSVLVTLLADVRDIETLRLSKRWLWLYVLAGPCLAAIRVCDREIKSRWLSI